MNFQEIYTDSDPSGIVKADVGTMFIREGTACFVRTPYGAIEKLQQTYRPKEYARKEYSKAKVTYNTPYEVWQKVANSGKNTGWKLVGNVKYFGNTLHVNSGGQPEFGELNPFVSLAFELYDTMTGERINEPEISYDAVMHNPSGSVTVLAYIRQVVDIPESASFNTASIYCTSASDLPASDTGFTSVQAEICAQFFNASGTTSSISWSPNGDDSTPNMFELYITNPYLDNLFYSTLPVGQISCYTVTESIDSRSLVVNNVQYNGLEKSGNLIGDENNYSVTWASDWAKYSTLQQILSQSITALAEPYLGGTLRLYSFPFVDISSYDINGEFLRYINMYEFPAQYIDVRILPSSYTGSLMLGLPAWQSGLGINTLNVWLHSENGTRTVIGTVDLMYDEASETDISNIVRTSEIRSISGSALLSFTILAQLGTSGTYEVAYDASIVSATGSAAIEQISDIPPMTYEDNGDQFTTTWNQWKGYWMTEAPYSWVVPNGHLAGVRIDNPREFSGKIQVTETAP